MRKRTVLFLVPLLALTAAGLQGVNPATAQAPTVNATLTEWSIMLDASSAPAGDSNWAATNAGTIPHELVFFKTDLAPDALPVGSDDKVNRFAEGIQDVGVIRSDDLVPGATVTETFNLAAGSYVLICNIPGHYLAGMRTAFTVTAEAAEPEDLSEPADLSPAAAPSTGTGGMGDGGFALGSLVMALAAVGIGLLMTAGGLALGRARR